MEEKQILAFVHQMMVDGTVRGELARDPRSVIMRQGFSPRVADIISHLVSHLSLDKPLYPAEKWWHA